MADIYKSVHENQLRNRLQILHVIDVDSANISKAFATDIKKAKDSAKEEKIRKVMKEFKEGTLKSSSGELVTDRKQAIAIAISEADNIEKSDDVDSDSSEKPIEKAQKANIGDIHVWSGKRYKKIGEGKWVEVSEQGLNKKEHEYQSDYSRQMSEKPSLHTAKHRSDEKWHKEQSNNLSDKEYTDEEIGADSDHKQGTQKWRKEIIGQGQDAHLITLKMHFPEETVAKFEEMEVGDSGVFKDKDGKNCFVSKEGKDIWYLGNKREDIQKSVFDEIQENIEKSLNSISTKVSEEILNDIEKSVNHKYFKREGAPGNYRYYYTEEEYKKKKGDSKIEDETEVKMDYLKYRLANHYNISSQSRLSNLKLDGTDSALDLSRALNLPIDDTNFTGVNNTIKKMRDEYVKGDDNKSNFVNDKQQTTISKLKEKINHDYFTKMLDKGKVLVHFKHLDDNDDTHNDYVIEHDGSISYSARQRK